MKPPAGDVNAPGQVIVQPENAPVAVTSGVRSTRRFLFFPAYLGILSAAFAKPLKAWATLAFGSDLHSYVLLIPLVSVYLIWIRWSRLSRNYNVSTGPATIPLLAGICALFASWRLQLDQNDYATLVSLSFVCFCFAGAFLILGKNWVRSAAFPLAFLIFMVPLPTSAIDYLETASQNASAEVANFFFIITGTPTLRDGNLFQLPGISLRVAQECSGIHSSLVLFITSILAAYLFLQTSWRRAVLVVFVIPLGLIRNGFRILVIALLCVHMGPQMINSPIHRKGGPIFFAASLLPLFALLWALYRSERVGERKARLPLAVD